MSNKEKIVLLSKYQMRVLYYKCKEGASHAEIAAHLDREINTIQYHMSKIYSILEIKKPGITKEEMDSELKNEICPIIRKMFNTFDDVNLWAPAPISALNERIEKPEDEAKNRAVENGQTIYTPPPSVLNVLRRSENQVSPPEIIEPPPRARHRVNWGRVFQILLVVVFVLTGWLISPYVFDTSREPTEVPTIIIWTRTPPPQFPTEARTETATIPPTPSQTITCSMTPSPTPTPTEIITQISPKDGMVMVFIPKGDFKMGSSRVEDPQTLDEEVPQHIVYLDDYWIDQTEVTNEKYAMCVSDSGFCTEPINFSSLTRPSYYDNPLYANYPVIFVSWEQAEAYCTWAGRRLPTEAEWEKAARGPVWNIYPWGNSFDGSLANYCDINCFNDWKDTRYDDGYTDTAPVGDYPGGASVYGVLDMAGNVYEWIQDWYAPYSRLNQTNPGGPGSGEEKIIRGGSWGDDPVHVRTAIRSYVNPVDFWMNFIGFRCAQ